MTSIFHRRFYPDDVDGTVAYVAPVLYADDMVQSPNNRFMQFLRQSGPTRRAAKPEDLPAHGAFAASGDENGDGGVGRAERRAVRSGSRAQQGAGTHDRRATLLVLAVRRGVDLADFLPPTATDEASSPSSTTRRASSPGRTRTSPIFSPTTTKGPRARLRDRRRKLPRRPLDVPERRSTAVVHPARHRRSHVRRRVDA